jgi:hypothetical protein
VPRIARWRFVLLAVWEGLAARLSHGLERFPVIHDRFNGREVTIFHCRWSGSTVAFESDVEGHRVTRMTVALCTGPARSCSTNARRASGRW